MRAIKTKDFIAGIDKVKSNSTMYLGIFPLTFYFSKVSAI